MIGDGPDAPAPRRVAIAGASSGIGAATATLLAERGHAVALGARRAEHCAALAAEIEAAGGTAFAHPLDVTDEDSVTRFRDAAVQALGPVDVLVCSVGGMQPARVWETEPADLAEALAVHVVGVQRLLAAFVPQLVAQRRGDVVVVGSDVVLHPRPRLGGYVAAKCALEGLLRVLQMELEGTGVRACVVRPGPTRTKVAADWSDEAIVDVVRDAERWGLLRHGNALSPASVAAAIAAAVSLPQGAYLPSVDVAPEAPADGLPA